MGSSFKRRYSLNFYRKIEQSYIDGIDAANQYEKNVSKSFISILGMYLLCMFRPGIKCFICAPQKGQGAKIAREKLFELYDLFPLLKKELVGEGAYGVDYVRLSFRSGSVFDVVSVLNSQRGGRRGGGILDEYRCVKSEKVELSA